MHTRSDYKFLYVLTFFLTIFTQASVLEAGTASLSWAPPSENADGTELSDLAGYTISYGTASGNYIEHIDVGNVTSYEVQGLASNITYYFTVTAYDLNGNESDSSNEGIKHISDTTLLTYYCDSDGDGIIHSSADGVCTGYGCEPSGCVTTPGNDCNDNNSAIHPEASDANCNGIDENCDGTPDNNYVASSSACGAGACQSSGQFICRNGTVEDTCTGGAPAGDDSDCNGIDDNCNGEVDENYTITATECGTGACQSYGQLVCSNGSITDTCIAGSPSGDDSDCNDIDDDCDGMADNHYIISTSSCGTGVCSSLGQVSCTDGREHDSCTPGAPDEQIETITEDGLDNDCDGLVDEGSSGKIDISRVLLAEDFSEGIPEFWTSDDSWNTDNPCDQEVGQPLRVPFVIADSPCAETGISNLATAPVDTTGCDTTTLSFSNQYYWYNGSAEVDISTDGGTTWSNHLYMDSDSGYPTPDWKEIDLGSVEKSDKTLANFKYANDSTAGFWAIDNIWITCKTSGLDFSSHVHMPSSPESVLISNTGSDSLSIDAIAIEGQDSSAFDLDQSDCLDKILLPGETCIMDLVFIPESDGAKNASLLITTNDLSHKMSSMLLIGSGISAVPPVPSVMVNGVEGPAKINKNDALIVAVDLDPNSYSNVEGDWWLLMEYKNRWHYYSSQSGKWRRGNRLYKQGPLSSMGPVEVLDTSRLHKGEYTFYFGVDTHMNGLQDNSNYFFDSVIVNIE